MESANKRIVVSVAAKFGAQDVRNVKFVKTSARRVRVTCQGKPPIVIRSYAGQDGATGYLYVKTRKGDRKRVAIQAANMKAAYRDGVKRFWN